MRRFRLFRVRSPLLTESMALSFPALTEMFHFGACGSFPCRKVTGFKSCRVSPFGNLRIEACSAATRSISQLAASFFASRSQGIHHVPLVACPHILEYQYMLSQFPKRWFTFQFSLEQESPDSCFRPSRFSQSPHPQGTCPGGPYSNNQIFQVASIQRRGRFVRDESALFSTDVAGT